MFILLHNNMKENSEVVINTDAIRLMTPGALGGTCIVFSDADGGFLVVEESINDIFARMKRE